MELKRNLIVVDVEADGPVPGLYSIVCFGAVHVNGRANGFVYDGKSNYERGTFYGRCAPLSWQDIDPWYSADEESGFVHWNHEALAVSGFSREEHLEFPDAVETFTEFQEWLSQFDRPVFVSDNPAFDWQFINFYFHLSGLNNPFGFSARRIGDFYAGLNGNWDDHNSWKNLRKTAHSHNPVDDALGNAEALLELLAQAHQKSPKATGERSEGSPQSIKSGA